MMLPGAGRNESFLSLDVRFEKTRHVLLEELAKHGLSFREWTTVAGGEGSAARVDQILAFVTASDVDSWAAVDDEDPQTPPPLLGKRERPRAPPELVFEGSGTQQFAAIRGYDEVPVSTTFCSHGCIAGA